MSAFIQTWSGSAVKWECDELDHLNMRHYMTKVDQARQMFFILMGLTEAFQHHPISSIRVKDFHIRYHKEAHPGDLLLIETGLVALDDDEATLLHIMYHEDRTVAATVIETVEHIYMRTQAAFSWPSRLKDISQDYYVTIPDVAKARGVDLKERSQAPNETQAQTWGMIPIGRGVFQSSEMNIIGRASAQSLLGRVTESIGNFTAAWQDMHDDPSGQTHAALLEGRVFIHRPARIGDPFIIYSGIRRADKNIRELIHNAINPLTGDSWFTMVGAGCLFDLKARRLVKASSAHLAQLADISIPELRP